MEKLKTYEKETADGSFSLIAHRFTETEQKELEAALCRYDPKAVNEFIYDLQLLCDAMIYLLRQSDRGSLRKDRERMLSRFKNAIEELQVLADRKGILDNWIDIKDILFDDQKIDERNNTWRMVMDTLINLERLVSIIEGIEIPSGRPTADQYGFATLIARLFHRYFGKPTGYNPDRSRKEGGGTFYNVIKISLNAIGKDIKDVRRHVDAALKAIKNLP